MSIENVNNRPVTLSVNQDPEVASSTQQVAEKEIEKTFNSVKSHIEDMLQFNFTVVGELLGQIAAISPYRPDSALGKQPEVAAIDASNAGKTSPVMPVGTAGTEGYVARLQHVEGVMRTQDLKLKRVFDLLNLSRSGRKPDLQNEGLEFERLKSIIIQAEGRMHQMASRLPETLPSSTHYNIKELLPEFIDGLRHFDASFREGFLEIQEEIARASQ